MPEIRAIERQGRRVTVEFDGAPRLDCDRAFAPVRNLAVGASIEGAILERLREQALRHDAMTTAERWLRSRPRSRADIAQRLQTRAIPPGIVEETLAELERRGFLNDATYAAIWAEDRARSRPRAARMVEAELRAQGVEAGLASTAAAAIDDEAAALELARARARRFQGDWTAFQRRVGGVLVRRGFSHELARRALRVVWEEVHDAVDNTGAGGDMANGADPGRHVP